MRPVNISVVPVGHDVALVWAAPAQPRGLLPTRTYVELVARKNGGQQTIFAGYATATATAVTLPPGRFEYAWRTLTVSPSAATYVTSAWVHFIASVRPTPPSGRPG
jgi:hypothetical protein